MSQNDNSAEKPTSSTGPLLFHYEKPVVADRKLTVHLAKTTQSRIVINVLAKGGENNLHAHAETDGFWFVLHGRVRFYTTDDQPIAELEEDEGILIPRGYPYWFDAIPGEDLELIRFAASTRPDVDVIKDRINFGKLKPNQISLISKEKELVFREA